MLVAFLVTLLYFVFFFFKQKTAYEMRISDWSSDVCSSDLLDLDARRLGRRQAAGARLCRRRRSVAAVDLALQVRELPLQALQLVFHALRQHRLAGEREAPRQQHRQAAGEAAAASPDLAGQAAERFGHRPFLPFIVTLMGSEMAQ